MLWILARQAHLPPGTIDQLIAKAERLGFPTDELIFVEHGNAPHTVAPSSLAK